MHKKAAPKNKLWTKNFSIITVGTVISMLGNAISGFTVGLLVLEIANSVLLYAVYNVLYNIPKVVMPTLAGPYLDRFSRRRIIYTLDFVSACMYLLMFLALTFGVIETNPSSYPLMLIFCVIIGTIDSIYQVAYESLYVSVKFCSSLREIHNHLTFSPLCFLFKNHAVSFQLSAYNTVYYHFLVSISHSGSFFFRFASVQTCHRCNSNSNEKMFSVHDKNQNIVRDYS